MRHEEGFLRPVEKKRRLIMHQKQGASTGVIDMERTRTMTDQQVTESKDTAVTMGYTIKNKIDSFFCQPWAAGLFPGQL